MDAGKATKKPRGKRDVLFRVYKLCNSATQKRLHWKVGEGRDGRYESKVQSMVCRALNVKVRNMGFVHQAMDSGSEKKVPNVRGLEHSFGTLDLLEASKAASPFCS